MIEINGTELNQWDTGRSVKVTGLEANHVHFANTGDSAAVVMDLVEGSSKIPDYLLQTGKQLCVYVVADGVTIERKTFSVRKRERPENYIYDEDHRNYIYQIISDSEKAVAEAERVTNELKAARDNGEFNGPQGPKGDRGEKGDSIVGPKGDKGDKGDPGVVKFKVVNELPEQDTENAIYLVPGTDGAEDNLFDEFIFIDGKWEKIGSAAVAVDLTDYVKKTDYATTTSAGITRYFRDYGVNITQSGYPFVVTAQQAEIDAKTAQYLPITPKCLDYAVKVALTTNSITLTDEEKASAQAWLGIINGDEVAY